MCFLHLSVNYTPTGCHVYAVTINNKYPNVTVYCLFAIILLVGTTLVSHMLMGMQSIIETRISNFRYRFKQLEYNVHLKY